MNLIILIAFVVLIMGTPNLLNLKTISEKRDGYNQVMEDEKNHTLVRKRKRVLPWEEEVETFEKNKQENNIDEVEGVLIRACKVVHTFSRYERCSDSSSTEEIWGFVGEPGEEGSLKEIWEGKQSSVFSCSEKSEYGRMLVTEALPYQKILYYEDGVVKPLKYNFSDMGNYHGDPCAYIDFVGKYE